MFNTKIIKKLVQQNAVCLQKCISSWMQCATILLSFFLENLGVLSTQNTLIWYLLWMQCKSHCWRICTCFSNSRILNQKIINKISVYCRKQVHFPVSVLIFTNMRTLLIKKLTILFNAVWVSVYKVYLDGLWFHV